MPDIVIILGRSLKKAWKVTYYQLNICSRDSCWQNTLLGKVYSHIFCLKKQKKEKVYLLENVSYLQQLPGHADDCCTARLLLLDWFFSHISLVREKKGCCTFLCQDILVHKDIVNRYSVACALVNMKWEFIMLPFVMICKKINNLFVRQNISHSSSRIPQADHIGFGLYIYKRG